MSEKRYFKIFSERHSIAGKNKYIDLFNLLEKAKVENDAEIKKQLTKNKINANFLSADKNYLYHLILKSLNDFHFSKTMNLELKEILLSIEILFLKGLYSEAIKLIQRAENLALECENFALMIDVLTWKKKCLGYSIGLNAAIEINDEIEIYLKKLNQLKQITNLYYQSYAIQQKAEGVFSQSNKNKMQRIISQQILLNENEIDSFTGKVYYYIILANYHIVFGDRKKEYKTILKLIDLINSSKTYKLENPLDYVSIYNRYLTLKKYNDADNFFKAIKELEEFGELNHVRKELVQQRIFVHSQTQIIEFYLIQDDHKNAIAQLKGIDSEIKQLNFPIEDYHLIYFNYLKSITFIFDEQYKKALQIMNETINEFKIEDRPQVYIRVLINNIATHFELKNYELIPSFYSQLIKLNTKFHLLLAVEIKLLEAITILSKENNSNKNLEKLTFKEVIKLIKETMTIKGSTQLLKNYEKWVNKQMI